MDMKRNLFFILLLCLAEDPVTFAGEQEGQPLKLPEPETRGDTSVEQAIGKRRSLRDFSGSLASKKRSTEVDVYNLVPLLFGHS